MIVVATRSQGFDNDMVKKSGKAMQICFICVIFLANISLILVRCVRHGCHVFSQARNCVQLSLALGGILGLFYNIVSAIMLFNMENHDLNCMTIYLSQCVFFTFLPLLYGTGLVILAIDLLLRFKTVLYKMLSQSKIYPLLCAILPWVISLIVACPLALTDIEWDLKCAVAQSLDHLQATIICCTIVPAGLVLFSIVFVVVIVQPRRSYTIQGFDSPMNTISNGSTGQDSMLKEMNYGPAGTYSKYNVSAGNGNASSTTPTSNSSVATSGVNTQWYPASTNDQAREFSSEKWKLLATMLMFILLVMPYSSIFMYVTTEYVSMYPMTFFYLVEMKVLITYYTCAAAFNLYTFIIPLIWLCSNY